MAKPTQWQEMGAGLPSCLQNLRGLLGLKISDKFIGHTYAMSLNYNIIYHRLDLNKNNICSIIIITEYNINTLLLLYFIIFNAITILVVRIWLSTLHCCQGACHTSNRCCTLSTVPDQGEALPY